MTKLELHSILNYNRLTRTTLKIITTNGIYLSPELEDIYTICNFLRMTPSQTSTQWWSVTINLKGNWKFTPNERKL